MGKISLLPPVDAPAGDDLLVLVDQSTGQTKRVPLADLLGIPNVGWISALGTWGYSSWSSTTKIGVITTSIDLTGSIQPGHRLKFDQASGTKYAIVHKITSSEITAFFGQDFDLDNEAITTPFYSAEYAPMGFVPSADKWSVIADDPTYRQQLTPTQNVWYNLGGFSLTIGIGKWRLSYMCTAGVNHNGNPQSSVHVILHTANNAGSTSSRFYKRAYISAGTTSTHLSPFYVEDDVDLAAQTTYYLNLLTDVGGSAGIHLWNATGKATIKAVSAYL